MKKVNMSRRQTRIKLGTPAPAVRFQTGRKWLSSQILAIFICYIEARSDKRQLPRNPQPFDECRQKTECLT